MQVPSLLMVPTNAPDVCMGVGVRGRVRMCLCWEEPTKKQKRIGLGCMVVSLGC